MEIEHNFYNFMMYNFCFYVWIFTHKIHERKKICENFGSMVALCIIITIFNFLLYLTGYIDYKALPKF